MSSVNIVHFSDLLCIWAYGGNQNLYRLTQEFGDRVTVDIHYCSVFPDTQTKISKLWGSRGGFDGYADHVKEVAANFDNLEVHPDTWSKARPRSSASPHLFIKAVELLQSSPSASAAFETRRPVQAARELRHAFFAEGQDVSNWSVQRKVCSRIGLDFEDVLQKIETGEAIAQLAADYELAQSLDVKGSPTYLMNEGRQKLFGNISYGILAANIKELLSASQNENASACS